MIGRKVELLRGDAATPQQSIAAMEHLGSRDEVEVFIGTCTPAVSNAAQRRRAAQPENLPGHPCAGRRAERTQAARNGRSQGAGHQAHRHWRDLRWKASKPPVRFEMAKVRAAVVKVFAVDGTVERDVMVFPLLTERSYDVLGNVLRYSIQDLARTTTAMRPTAFSLDHPLPRRAIASLAAAVNGRHCRQRHTAALKTQR